jgi:hypothetical protein
MNVLAAMLAAVAVHVGDHWQLDRHHRRHLKPDPAPVLTWHSAVASWYAEHGPGACGLGPDVQSGYRFASLILRCGTRVRFCRAGRCADAIMADHGPYVAGRTFDLNRALSVVLDCPGVCTVRWAVLS